MFNIRMNISSRCESITFENEPGSWMGNSKRIKWRGGGGIKILSIFDEVYQYAAN